MRDERQEAEPCHVPSVSQVIIRKNGIRRGKQNPICVDCGRQFVDNPQTEGGYSDDVRQICLKMYVNGHRFRAIERVTGVHHITVITWVQQVGELDELQTFVSSKKQNLDLDGG